MRSLALPLAKKFAVSYFQISARSPVAIDGVECLTPRLLSDPYGHMELPAVLDRSAPDVFLACHDAHVLAELARIVREHRSHTRVMLYIAFEWAEMSGGTVAGLNCADDLVCYTDTARTWLAARLGPGGRHINVIPHGLDLRAFGPITPAGAVTRARVDSSEARSRARRLLGLPDNRLLILNANRDTPRKRLSVTLDAFSEIAPSFPGVDLVLTHGEEFGDYVRDHGISSRVIVPSKTPDDTGLNLYYNASDIGMNTCTGEGWGLVAMEHAAAGAAQVMPDHPALREIWKQQAVFVECSPSHVPGYGLSAAGDHATALAGLLRDAERRKHYGDEARKLVSSPEFSWESVSWRWATLIEAGAPLG
ncbi:glycosyltransferase family 4 protein [Streptomyces sp. XC 2026]|uniref:glycosyltransferase family 4 protein n=1 Tax=Streptomyces sp. XC 2026 TaxID=2782004 RepID=UPI00190415DE|nr:glycosyltransferase family 4 protein [Streptomyces sp. XC 2026]QQN80276.1 glycosyltransferase family 4 protein [Streptomyces sp. XC 2026]